VSGTPAVFVNGFFISGAQPYEQFRAAVEHLLDPDQNPLPGSSQPSSRPPSQDPVQFEDLTGRPSMGPEDAAVTLVEFGDFHCPFCGRVSPTMKQLMEKFDGNIRRVWRHFPLAMHKGAEITHQASECAHDQGKFWEFHELVFDHQTRLKEEGILKELAKKSGLDLNDYQTCMASGKHASTVKEDLKAGQSAGVRGTPAVFINGKLIYSARECIC